LGHPGITSDEPLDVRPGRTYVQKFIANGLGFFRPEVVQRVFADNAEHPPLGRWLLGVAAWLGEPFEPFLGGPDPFSVHAARLAPALAFAALVAIVTLSMARRRSLAAGAGAGLALVLMPRVFAHAHVAALDTFLCLFWTAALLAAARALQSSRPILAMAGAGVDLALALLTKIHGWLLLPVVACYAIALRPNWRTVIALAAWAGAGVIVYFAAWPWLWYHTAERLRGYFGTGIERAPILVQYFGKVYADRDVPWHYPWFYFAVTVPVGLHALGIVGLIRGWRERRGDSLPLLLAGAIVAVLAVFSTRVPVYDGERLFLVVFPLWAMLIGLGFETCWRWACPRRLRSIALCAFLAAQAYGVVALHPFGLSYYNALVGGLPGAERLGLELTYWGDAIDPVLLDELARSAEPGQVAALLPSLHHIQPTASLTARLAQRQISLRDQSAALTAAWLLVYRRTAYWPPGLAQRLRGSTPLYARSRQGVWLSGLWPGPAATPEKARK
jgi:4-amino-4-deoxy-L-arabinose transferase-like glycosyltransferase